MIIIAAYNLEAFQLDAVNAFTNSKLNEIIHYTFLNSFQQDGKCLQLL